MQFFQRYRYPLALLFAIGCAAGAILLTKYYFETRERQLREKIRLESRLTNVVVAKRDLATGSPINLDTMRIESIPFQYVPDGAVTPDQYSSYEHKFLSDPVSAGKPLLRQFVEGVSRAEKFSDILAAGERAITLEVDGVTSIEHMIEAGDFIDLAVRQNKSKDFRILLERTRVLSTGNLTVADPKFPGMYKKVQYSTITLGIEDRLVSEVFRAQGAGDLVFLLRNTKDERQGGYPAEADAKNQVEIFAGGESENGVLKSKLEQIHSGAERQSLHTPARNSKGRLVKILPVNTAPSKQPSGKVAGALASNE